MENETGKNWDTCGGEPEQILENIEELDQAFRAAILNFARKLQDVKSRSIHGAGESVQERFATLRQLGSKLPRERRDRILEAAKSDYPDLPIEEI